MKVTSAIAFISSAFALSAQAASVVHVDAARDATVAYNAFLNKDGTYDAYTPKGRDRTLDTLRGTNDYRRILLGFNLPGAIRDPSRIVQCRLNIPKPKDNVHENYVLTASAASNNWEESSVDARTQLGQGRVIGASAMRNGKHRGAIDVTAACRAAQQGRFSLLVDSNQPHVVFHSRNSGKEHFSVDIAVQ
ncbi:hypothetical protein GGF46_005035 [Coemansia sp. RSA 552]|nr:hypothetical protein GGF46_005035 [Coemansia sp. RSA 552]